MRTILTDQFGHKRTCYIVNEYIIKPGKHFGNKARNDFNNWGVFVGVCAIKYTKTLKEAKEYCNN